MNRHRGAEGGIALLKFVGALLVLLAGTLFGFFQAQQLSRRPKQIRQLILALGRLETEIAYGFTHLPDALTALSRQSAEPLSRMFGQMADQLNAAAGRSVNEIWQAAVRDGWKLTSMKEAEKEIMLQLGVTLGQTDREDQVKHLRLGVAQLQAEEELARDEQKRYEKMWKSLGVLSGALVVILIY
jgi:stage III sporulation protein AB